MPTYSFRCADGDEFDARFSIVDVPASTTCPHCGQPAKRMPSAPYVSRAGSSAYGLIDRSASSAHEPEVVSGTLPGAPRRAGGRYTTNPLHQKLPRT
ncbi:FmdB family zinc ribbon protein [Glaciibacter superstes]|uniref:FmdB family zinc ribbon protein n=1 Tax=Glaciibacter superstes TaxID=501023 RepID=UPI000A063983|nr:zinc ribbon domain-containing protein [Glaciibacter superstes]